ncbi:hypothetical protein FA95DRAFT_1027873 [Auriscalpium vulgare]|uniref:Uncharacterized protein n=1 Tax=Auriscalpium vulgare TaxID=40419 RepID=A0ACB8R6J5_9AGAM|nr:hypothetical protein FA95DRAFT_1027873 [Auriscalpium vulgare]
MKNRKLGLESPLDGESGVSPLNHRRLKDVVDGILRARLGSDFEGVGKNWTARFVQRHSDRLQTFWTRSLDSIRGRAVNPTTNAAWFDLVNKTVAEYNIIPELTWGTDEAGFNPALADKQRAIGRSGRKVLYQQRNGIRENITVIATICGDGTSLPPAVIFKGQAYQVRWKQNNPLNALKKDGQMVSSPLNGSSISTAQHGRRPPVASDCSSLMGTFHITPARSSSTRVVSMTSSYCATRRTPRTFIKDSTLLSSAS